MKRLVVLIAIGSIVGGFFAMACGDGASQKPPLTPDTEHALEDAGGGGSSTGGDQ